jgi:hypothetical protein
VAAAGLLEAVDQHRIGRVEEQQAVRHAVALEILEHPDEGLEVRPAARVGRDRRVRDLAALVAEQVGQRPDHLGRQVVDAEVAGVLEGGHRLRLARAAEPRDDDEVLDHRILLT